MCLDSCSPRTKTWVLSVPAAYGVWGLGALLRSMSEEFLRRRLHHLGLKYESARLSVCVCGCRGDGSFCPAACAWSLRLRVEVGVWQERGNHSDDLSTTGTNNVKNPKLAKASTLHTLKTKRSCRLEAMLVTVTSPVS